MKLKSFGVLLIIMIMQSQTLAQGNRMLYSRDNLIAWCVVPFDSKNRNAEQRAQMLKQLGINKLAYDWREKHVPYFDDELNALKKNNIALQSFWYYSGPNPENDKNFAKIIEVLK